MHKYKITLEYDGTGYSGWQTQKNAKSVQGTLIEASRHLFGEVVDVQGAGRTDAGVHAMAQVAHIETTKKIPVSKIIFGLNDLLPATINIMKVEEAAPRFHARHHARKRSYLYQISKRRTAFGKRYVWWIKDDLDVKKMSKAGSIFKGFHDYISFADKRFDKDSSTMVMLEDLEIHDLDDLIVIRVSGSHFLWKMVRRMVGVLVEVGRGNLSGRDVQEMLAGYTDIPAKHTAPPSGLFLEQVLYEGMKEKPFRLPGMYPAFQKIQRVS